MRKTILALALAMGFALPAAADDNDGGLRFKAHLIGGDLAGNVIATNATGEASLSIINDDKNIRFKVNIAGIRNLWQAHIHVAAQGPVAPNQPVGPIVFFFTPSSGGAQSANVPSVVNGEMSGGFILTNQQLVGPLTFDPNNPTTTGIAGLVKAIEEQRATIVVHTSDLNNANNQTPGVAGDSPAGEIRGLIMMGD
ncbi:MAG: CHRD domain-containing protein [Betaproteobacteria bacterium]